MDRIVIPPGGVCTDVSFPDALSTVAATRMTRSLIRESRNSHTIRPSACHQQTKKGPEGPFLKDALNGTLNLERETSHALER
ncbi:MULTISPECIES: hypothetical protein [Xanthomonas]|uniref:hypothetical protein n=1 Tax=Xanthomonas TaxID=338 RepID=UPI00105475D1|nr:MULTISPECIES: hypothetical protein [Xanthomonas]MCC4631619.1 hypothetical protein [Xanthomonas citri]NMI15930.1 hypothetical protein [Xanthomonas citri]QGL18140.1 hypothetical protein GH913_16150 [Xanthomonas citri pv. malvacearum]WAW89036.1 hypothetical protein LPY96_12025 [Xanthomonas citri pv. malvacearum]WAW93120.1 hypothetical protein LPY95_10960 [Xanthomonas citri pv. malvacearum]